MRARSLLTIVVPTYNRADCLELLLTTLVKELGDLQDQVAVIVGDNASTDRTPDVAATFLESYSTAVVLRHSSNVGAEENFCRCIEKVESPYFWIIGDDDLPRAGVVRQIFNILMRDEPDLIFLTGDARRELTSNEPDGPVTILTPIMLERMAFARRAHVHLTFISAVIVNRDVFMATHTALSLRRFSGTSLVQLGWVLALLKSGLRFMYVPQKCILALQGNTGGYSVLRVFGHNFSLIVSQVFGSGSPIANAIVRRCAVQYLPPLIWNLRFGSVGIFDCEDPRSALRPQMRTYLSYWLFLIPIAGLPRPLAWVVLKAAQLSSIAISLHDRLREKLSSWARAQ